MSELSVSEILCFGGKSILGSKQNGPNLNTHRYSFKFMYSIYLNIKQLDALNFIMSLFHASTCFEHKCLSSEGQNCIIQPLVSSHL